MPLRRELTLRRLAAAGLTAAAVVAVLATPQLLGDRVLAALRELSQARPAPLWLAGLAFAVGLVGLSHAWRAGLEACGGRVGRLDGLARYGAGSLVNTFVPAGAGSAVRIALYARTLPGRDRLLTSASVGGAVDLARGIALAPLVLFAAWAGVLPGWTALLVAALLPGAGAAFLLARRFAAGRLARLLDAFRALVAAPRAAAALLGWSAVYMGARVLAAAAIATAVGIEAPLRAALVAVPALALAGVVQLTPGNVGVASGAIALALRASGVDLTTAISAGIAFHGIETLVSVAIGAGGVVSLSQPRVPAWTVRLAGAGAVVAVAGAFGATVLA